MRPSPNPSRSWPLADPRKRQARKVQRQSANGPTIATKPTAYLNGPRARWRTIPDEKTTSLLQLSSPNLTESISGRSRLVVNEVE